MTWWLWIIVVLLVLTGLAGTLLPALPGVPLIFAALAFAAWMDGFAEVSLFSVVLLGVLAAVAVVVDLLASLLGAKKVGASRLAVIGAAVGTVAGLFLGLPGLILGPFAGAAIGEFITLRDAGQATRVGVATWLGLLFGTLAKLAIAGAMVGVFVTAFVL